MRYLMNACFWAGSNYWSTRSPRLKTDRTKSNIKICYLVKCEWFAFIFSKFHPQAVEVFCSQQKTQRWFYKQPVNSFLSFSAWCISEPCFESVIGQLRSIPGIELEFVVPDSSKGLCVPAPFADLGLQFYEIGEVLKNKIPEPSRHIEKDNNTTSEDNKVPVFY